MAGETPESITQATRIAEADRLLSIGPVVVRADASLRQFAEKAVENSAAWKFGFCPSAAIRRQVRPRNHALGRPGRGVDVVLHPPALARMTARDSSP